MIKAICHVIFIFVINLVIYRNILDVCISSNIITQNRHIRSIYSNGWTIIVLKEMNYRMCFFSSTVDNKRYFDKNHSSELTMLHQIFLATWYASSDLAMITMNDWNESFANHHWLMWFRCSICMHDKHERAHVWRYPRGWYFLW